MTQIGLRVTDAYGAIERIFRVIRHRRFTVRHCDIQLRHANEYAVKIEVSGFRSTENLIEQLQKLIDVQQVSLLEVFQEEVVKPQVVETGVLSYAT